jgi:NAD(P)-dependent dehydrogenase (short-subunit alcohol dehydrogenase family)
VDFEDPNFERRPYDRWVAYGQSKTANVLFALRLNALGKGHGIRAFSLHPGGILTNLARHMSPEQIRAQGAIDDDGRPVIDPARGMKNVEQGAATTVWCATSPQLDGLGGLYCEDCDVAVVTTELQPQSRGVWPWAVDAGSAERLWTLSEDLAGACLPT